MFNGLDLRAWYDVERIVAKKPKKHCPPSSTQWHQPKLTIRSIKFNDNELKKMQSSIWTKKKEEKKVSNIFSPQIYYKKKNEEKNNNNIRA